MNRKILIGSDEGTYTNTNGARTITITGLSWTLTNEQLAYIYNKTQDLLYYAPAVDLALCSVSAGVITIDSTLPVLATADVIHIQVWKPNEGFDTSLDSQKAVVQNPEYAHTTSVETLIDEADISGTQATSDLVGSDEETIKDADGAFSVASTAVGYKAYQTDASDRDEYATVLSVDSTTQITLSTLSSAETWAQTGYCLPGVWRYEINMETYKNLTIHYYLRNGASLNTYLKIYGTLNSAATVDADTSWVDLSSDLFSDSDGINCTASTTLEDIVEIKNVTMLKYMLKLVVECSLPSGEDNDYEVYIKKS